MRALGVELFAEEIEALLLLDLIACGRPCGLSLQGQVHALVASVLLRIAGLDAFDGDAEAEPPDGKPREIEEAVGRGEGNTIVGADGGGETAFAEETFEGGHDGVFAGPLVGFAHEQEARGVICHGEGIAVAPVAELELALEVGTPEIVGGGAGGERCALGFLPFAAHALDEAVTIEDGMDGGGCGNAGLAGEAAHEELSDLSSSPVGLVTLAADNEAFDLLGELVGIADGTA